MLRTIRHMACSADFKARNYMPSVYRDTMGRMRPQCLITRDGFDILAGSFKGPGAVCRVVGYLDAFNAMEEELRELLAHADAPRWRGLYQQFMARQHAARAQALQGGRA